LFVAGLIGPVGNASTTWPIDDFVKSIEAVHEGSGIEVPAALI
jgi:hypothetical protein